ncbi:hypothetical protein Leryth_002232 [Lithospermum erythrorhizon]|nr:hypothetical protein Leryth_002232 [Lithospermum erythrorhizon]
MDERNESDNNKLDEVMLPGFRFHPTDEELVGFYLKRKIQQRPLSVELIKQVDIYKYDPWDLPKLATIGEKEWYFFCPRDRKYRNSARPNRVTGAGFWKATGTDRPIYNSEGSKCIGLKKSLVFYKGRAAKGIKTDWMMHEFRLPSTTDPSLSAKRYIEKHIPANDAWAICRIFKKTNNSTPQRAPLSHSWVSPMHQETTTSHGMVNHHIRSNPTQLSLDTFSLPQKTNTNFHYYGEMSNLLLDKSSLINTYTTLEYFPTSYKSIDHHTNEPSLLSASDDLNTNYTFSSSDTSEPSKSTINDASSLLLNMSSSIFGDIGKNVENNNVGYEMLHDNGTRFSVTSPHGDIQGHYSNYVLGTQPTLVKDSNSNNILHLEEDLVGSSGSDGFPYYGLPLSLPDAWKTNLVWD